jgi:hypothetical protein
MKYAFQIVDVFSSTPFGGVAAHCQEVSLLEEIFDDHIISGRAVQPAGA